MTDQPQHDDPGTDPANTDAPMAERLARLPPAAWAEDRDDDGTLVVVARLPHLAAAHTVAATGQTVAEMNPDYPAEDPVLLCAYRNGLDSEFGDGWRDYPPSYLAHQVGDRGVPVYSFPASRLEPTAPEEPEDA